MTEYTFDEQIISDLHKDAYGHRPTNDFWTYWNQSSDDWKQKIWDELLRAHERAVAEEQEREQYAMESFRDQIADNIALGAKDREQAIRWIIQALNPDEIDLRYGGSWVCYKLGLPFNMQTQFDPICKQLENA